MCTSLGITYSMSMFIYIYICIKFRFLYKLSKWKSIIFIIISVFSRWEMLKWIQQNLWLMKHHQFQLPNRYKFHGSNVIMKTWKGRKIAEMWEESSSGNHVQFELFTFSQDRLNSKTKKSYLWAASKQEEYNYIQIDYSCYPALHFFSSWELFSLSNHFQFRFRKKCLYLWSSQ